MFLIVRVSTFTIIGGVPRHFSFFHCNSPIFLNSQHTTSSERCNCLVLPIRSCAIGVLQCCYYSSNIDAYTTGIDTFRYPSSSSSSYFQQREQRQSSTSSSNRRRCCSAFTTTGHSLRTLLYSTTLRHTNNTEYYYY